MPVKHLTQQEVREKLGSGIVMSGIKPPKKSPQPSTSTSEADNNQTSSSSAAQQAPEADLPPQT